MFFMNQFTFQNRNNLNKVVSFECFRRVSEKQKGRSPGAIFSDSDGNQWLGKFAEDRQGISGKRRVIQEAFGYALYQVFGINVPKWELVNEVMVDASETWWILTEWLANFKTFEGKRYDDMMSSKKPPADIKTMARGLAIAKFFSEPDCFGGDGDNAGYIEQNNKCIFVKIDPANMFEFGWEKRLLGTEFKNVAFNGGESMFSQTEKIFLFETFSTDFRDEFLTTLKEILNFKMIKFSDVFNSILPQCGIIAEEEKSQLMGLIQNRKKEINQLYFSAKTPNIGLTTTEKKLLSPDLLWEWYTQLKPLITPKQTRYKSMVSALPKFSKLWFLAETIVYPNIQLEQSMTNSYPKYWLEQFDGMTAPYYFPKSSEAPVIAYLCLLGKLDVSINNEDQTIQAGDIFIANFKDQSVALHPSKCSCLLIEIYNN